MEDSQPTQIACSGDKAIGVAGQPFGEEVRWVIHGPNQPSQQKTGIERGLSIGRIHGRAWYPVVCIPLISTEDQYDSHQKHCQLGLNLTETGQNKDCQTFGILLGFYTQTMECTQTILFGFYTQTMECPDNGMPHPGVGPLLRVETPRPPQLRAAPRPMGPMWPRDCS